MTLDPLLFSSCTRKQSAGKRLEYIEPLEKRNSRCRDCTRAGFPPPFSLMCCQFFALEQTLFFPLCQQPFPLSPAAFFATRLFCLLRLFADLFSRPASPTEHSTAKREERIRAGGLGIFSAGSSGEGRDSEKKRERDEKNGRVGEEEEGQGGRTGGVVHKNTFRNSKKRREDGESGRAQHTH